MATPKRTRRTVSVARDDALDASLATVMRTGMTQSDAVRYALAFLAHGYQSAWDAGAVPDGQAPRRACVRVERQDTHQGPNQQV